MRSSIKKASVTSKCFLSFSGYKHLNRKARKHRAGFSNTSGIKANRNLAKKLPSARSRHFCILLLPGKSMASGGTRPAGLKGLSTTGTVPVFKVLILFSQTTRTVEVARQQLHFLCVDKENGSKRKRPNPLPALRVPEDQWIKDGSTKTRFAQTVRPAGRL